MYPPEGMKIKRIPLFGDVLEEKIDGVVYIISYFYAQKFGFNKERIVEAVRKDYENWID